MSRRVIKESPKALGTVQIIIGALVLLFGIVLNAVADSVNKINSVNKHVMYWGSITFMISGIVTVSSLDYRHPYVVKTALAMNLVSVVTASIAAREYSIDALKSPESECAFISWKMDAAILYCTSFWKHAIGNSKMLQHFTILEVFVSFATFVVTWITRETNSDSTESAASAN